MDRLTYGLLAVLLVASGCGGPNAHSDPLRSAGGSFVRLDSDPGVAAKGENAHPADISSWRLRTIFGSVQVKAPRVPHMRSIGITDKGPLFEPEDLEFLAPALAKALAKASPKEHAVFYLRQAGRLLRTDVTTGAVAVRGRAVHLTLGHFRRADIEGPDEDNLDWQKKQELKAYPLDGVSDFGVRLSVAEGQRWRPGDDPRTLVFPLPPRSLVQRTADERRAAGRNGDPALTSEDSPAPSRQFGSDSEVHAEVEELETLRSRLREQKAENMKLRKELQEIQGQLKEQDKKFQSLQRDIELIKRLLLQDSSRSRKTR